MMPFSFSKNRNSSSIDRNFCHRAICPLKASSSASVLVTIPSNSQLESSVSKVVFFEARVDCIYELDARSPVCLQLKTFRQSDAPPLIDTHVRGKSPSAVQDSA